MYQFNAKTAEHYFCNVCGIYPFHKKRVAPDHYGVNVFCLDGSTPDGIEVRSTEGATLSTIELRDIES